MNYLAPIISTPGDFASETTIDDHSRFMLDDAFKAVNSTPRGWEILKRTDVPGTHSCNYCGTDASRRPTCRICDGSGTAQSSFMFDTHPDPLVASTVKAIDKKLDGGHSGASYGWTMRNMEAIAKKGWEVYLLKWRLSHLKEKLEDRNLTHDQQRDLHAIKFKLERMLLDAEAKFKNPPPSPIADALQQARTVDAFLGTQAAQNATADPLAFANAIRNDPGMRAMIPDIDQQADAMSRFAKGQMSYAEMRSLCG